MRTQKSWDQQQQATEAAKVLAILANLEPEGVEEFRRNHRDFVPPVWWSGPAASARLGIYVPWIYERDLLRKAWAAEFPADITIELATTNLFLAAHALASDSTEQIENTATKSWAYQRAVLFLHVNPKRAKRCEWCHRYFVGENSNARFCPEDVDGNKNACFWAKRRNDWTMNSEQINERRRRKYRKDHRTKLKTPASTNGSR